MLKNKSLLFVSILVLLAVAGGLQRGFIYDRWKRDYSTNQNGEVSSNISGEQLLVALAGFREMVAGILWVKGDSFFDSGNYDAILPIVRLVTWLDPHQIDVYSTGMWHIAYNFTDEEERSDRRYIPSALALGKEGTQNNPETYELFFEEGWLWYHKIDDNYDKAVYWFEQAHKRGDIPDGRKNLLVNAYIKNNQIQDALNKRFELLDAAEGRVSKDASFGNLSMRDTIEGNADNDIVRMVQRGWLAQKRNDGSYATGNYDTKPPYDVKFSAQATVVESRVLKVVGTWNVAPLGTRVRCVLRDSDYPFALGAGMEWDKPTGVNLDPPKDRVFMQEQLFVRNKRFNRRIDMSKDPTMYPFNPRKTYYLEFYYNARMAPEHIKDKFGFNGEGMTDQNFLRTDIRPDCRVVFARLELTGEQILRRKDWIDNVPVVQTKNYVPIKVESGDEDVINIPGLRGSQPPSDQPVISDIHKPGPNVAPIHQ